MLYNCMVLSYLIYFYIVKHTYVYLPNSAVKNQRLIK